VLLQVISQLSGKQFSQTVFTALEGQANPSWIASWIADEVSDPDQLLGSALADMHDDKDRAAFIEAFAPHFSDRTFMDGLPAAMSIGDRHLRSQALDAMTTSMPLRLQEHAFSALRAFKDEQGRADGLMALLPHVLTASADSARRIIHSFHDARIRAEVNARAEALFAARPQETIDQATRILNYLFQDFRVGFASSTSDVAASLAVSLNTQQDTILRHLCVPRISSAALASRVALPAVRP
jgi:hypothetical protein